MTLMFIFLISCGTTVLSLGLSEKSCTWELLHLSCWAFWESSLASLPYTFLDIIKWDLAYLNGFCDHVRFLVQCQHGLITTLQSNDEIVLIASQLYTGL